MERATDGLHVLYLCVIFFFLNFDAEVPSYQYIICMMKKVLFMLAMLTCIFASCSDGGSEDPINPTEWLAQWDFGIEVKNVVNQDSYK